MAVPKQTIFEAEKKKIIALLLENSISIPVYQRDYTWGEDNLNAFLDDIKRRNIDDSQHYLGAIAIAQEIESKNSKSIRIIDGQQRLTTSLIIYTVLLDLIINSRLKFAKTEYFRKREEIKRLSFSHELKEGKLDENLQNLMHGEYRKLTSNFQKNYNLAKNYFSGLILEDDISPIQGLLVTLEENFGIAVIIFTIERKNEMIAFESLNSIGEPLKDYDLIKNHLISMCVETGGQKREESVYERNLRLFNDLMVNEHLLSDMGLKQEPAELSSLMDDFFLYYTAFKAEKIPIKTKRYWIFKDFKNLVEKDREIRLNEYEEMLKDMRKFFVLFLRISKKKKEDDNEWFKPLTYTSTHLPLIFGIYDKFAEFDSAKKRWNQPKKVIEWSRLIVFYMLKIAAVQGTKSSKISFWLDIWKMVKNGYTTSDVITKIDSDATFDEVNVTDGDFIASVSIGGKAPWIKEALVLVLGLVSSEGNGTKEYFHPTKATLEHIMPQTPGVDWPGIDKKSENFKRTNNLVGNLAAIDNFINTSASNKSFATKKKFYAPSKSPLLTGENLTISCISDYPDFTYSVIEERTRQLAKDIVKFFRDNLV